MAIYSIEIKGRAKPVLVKAESAAKAKDMFVAAAALTAEQMQDAIVAGDKVWNGTDPLPVDQSVADLADARFEAGEAIQAGQPVLFRDGKIYPAEGFVGDQ